MWTWSSASAPSAPWRAHLNLQTTGALTLGASASSTTYSLRTLWGQIYYDTATTRWRIQRGSGHLHVVFHCFAGVNRSTAAAFAFLTQECNTPLRFLIGRLCQVRPGHEHWRPGETEINSYWPCCALIRIFVRAQVMKSGFSEAPKVR